MRASEREGLRPRRVRRLKADGSSEEVMLASYTSANNPDELRDSIMCSGRDGSGNSLVGVRIDGGGKRLP